MGSYFYEQVIISNKETFAVLSIKDHLQIIRLKEPFKTWGLSRIFGLDQNQNQSIIHLSFDKNDERLFVLFVNYFYILHIEADTFTLSKKFEIQTVKEAYFLNEGHHLMIKRDKHWMLYRSQSFQKLKRIDNRNINSIIFNSNNQMSSYINKDSIVKFSQKVGKNYYADMQEKVLNQFKEDSLKEYEFEGSLNGIVPAIFKQFLKSPDKKDFVEVLKNVTISPLGMNIYHYFAIYNEEACIQECLT